MSISGLKADTGYALYVIGGNAHPGYPDLMEEKFVETILFTTEPAPPVEYLDLGDDLRQTYGLLFVVLLFLGMGYWD